MEETIICHNCKGSGRVDGGAKKKGIEPKRIGKCLYCSGSGRRIKKTVEKVAGEWMTEC